MFKWSEKIFLKINSRLGKNKLLDNFFYFSANFLIYILIFVFLFLVCFYRTDFCLLVLSSFCLGLLLSYLTAIICKWQRPIIKYPKIKMLFQPFQTWKTFPSDHSLISFLLVFWMIILNFSVFYVIMFLILALLIASARVYAGVHYPRDIIGGFVYALIISLFYKFIFYA